MRKEVSIYSNVVDTQGERVYLSAILDGIKNGKWAKPISELRFIMDEKDQKAFKNTLPCFTASGSFKKRTIEGLVSHSGVLIIDIDAKDNPFLSENFDEIRQKLIADKHTLFFFTSCRGNGIAVGVRIDGEKHGETFQYLEHYYTEKHGLTIDKGCKDVTRLRFISYDPDLYYNAGAETVIVPPEFTKETKFGHTAPVSYANGKNHEIIKAIINSGKLLSSDDTYGTWVRIGFALANEFGEGGRPYFHELSRISPKYDPADCDRKFDNCLKTNRGDVTFATIVQMAKEAGIDALMGEAVTVVTVVTVASEKKIEITDFPVDVFPVGLKKMVQDVSDSMGVPVSVTGSIALTILGAAIGNTIRISPKMSFEVSPFLWTCVVMPTGSGKSPLLELLVKPIKGKQAATYRRYKNELKQYQLSLRAFKKNDSDELPDEPILEQYMINDSTVEALSTAFEGQPRGLLSIQDELASWLLGMNQYKSSGNDRQAYLQLFNSGDWSINRKSGIRIIPSTGLGIVGNIQPETIPLVFNKDALNDGLIQRLLFVYPDTQPMKFNRNTIGNLYLWDDILSWCYQLSIVTNDNGCVIPKILRIEGTALDSYEHFYNEFGAIATVLPSRYRGFISKLFLYCLKFAGILHVVHSYGSDLSANIPESVVTDAIKLTKFYFGQISLILKLYERNTKTISEPQNRLVRVLYDLRGDVDKGMLQLEMIVGKFNEGLPANFQLTSKKIANILRDGWGLAIQKSTGNHSYLIWEDEKMKKLFKPTVTTVTTVTEKTEKRDAVTDVTDDSVKFMDEEIPEVEYAEVISNV